MDSQISAERDLLIRETFNIHDTDGDGRLSYAQLEPALKELGISLSESEFKEVERKLEVQSSKRDFIEYKHFRSFVIEQMPDDKDGVVGIVEAFKVFNRSGNGLVTPKEIVHVL